jgi:hypothetical protein
MIAAAAIVEGRHLIETVVASIVAGLGITFAFSVAIRGAARFGDFNREERTAAAGLALASVGLALAVVVAGVVFGIVVMTSK